MKVTNLLFLVPALSLMACGEEPVERALLVDGPQSARFEADRRQCINLARNYDDGSSRREAAVGAAIGGLAGAVEDDLEGAIIGAAIGGTIGKIEGEAELDEERRDVVIRCMQNRGHSVVG